MRGKFEITFALSSGRHVVTRDGHPETSFESETEAGYYVEARREGCDKHAAYRYAHSNLNRAIRDLAPA